MKKIELVGKSENHVTVSYENEDGKRVTASVEGIGAELIEVLGWSLGKASFARKI